MGSSPTELASFRPHLRSQTSESANSKPQNNVDLSWLPNYNDTNDSRHSNHQYPKTDSDDSWLPNNNDSSDDSWLPNNNASDDSWLPSIPNIINKNYDSQLPNCKNNSSLISSKSNNSNRAQKSETSPDRSWLPSAPIAINGDIKKEINNQYKKSTNQQTQNNKISNKKPEPLLSKGQISPSLSECSVETDSLGGVSTLLRRWKDAEPKNPNRKSKPSSCSNSNNGNHTTGESLVNPEYRKSGSSVPISCTVSSRGTNDLKAVNVEENKCFASVIGKPRLIRGRQAFIDFLNMMEQDKRRELESLTRRKPVSNFQNRGRIQALLRVRLIRIGAENQKQAKSQKNSVSKTIKGLWDKISAGVKQESTALRKVTSNEEGIKKSNTILECSNDRYPVRDESTTTTANSQELLLTNTSNQSSVIDEKVLADCIPVQSEMNLENCHHWINECSETQSDWDEDEDEFYNYNYNYNWINDIARPRSDWEIMRQKRYQEMLLHSFNQDIQQLLQSKSVSGFLSSGQRNLLDQLMVTRTQGVSRAESRKEDKYEEDEFINQTAYSSPPTQPPAPEQRSWNNNNHHPNANLYLQNTNNTPQASFINHPSIEMEVIYDLRGYVQQIHQEVMELKKVVTTCVNLQLKNQHQSTQKKRSEQVSATNNCCVCYAKQADSFMYRCGHMCTCYDCGVELQCNSGNCPICKEPILDVVKAYAYGD